MNDLAISSLGASYMNMDNYRISSSTKVQDSNFKALLERAYSAQDSRNSQDSGPSPIPQSPNSKVDKNDKLYQLCLELETFLVKNLLTGMRNTVQKSGLVDDSYAGKMYEDMLYDEYAKSFAQNASFGLAEQAYLQLTNTNRIMPDTL